MSNISTFGTFTVARLGIYAAHKALDITGNNIANINTEGYTRQSIDQFSMNMGAADRYNSMMDTRTGSGAFVAGVTQERDQYLDIRYRTEQANVGMMEARVDGLNQIASVLDEVGRGEDSEGVLEARFEEMVQMMQELNTKGAGKDDFDTLFRSAAASVVDTIHSYAGQLEEIRQNMAQGLHDEVDEINSILTRIRDLNTGIRKTQIYGGNALEQQDERNLLLDQLSKYVKIDISTEKEYLGEKLYVDKLVVKTADEPQRTLVSGIFATQLEVRQVEQKYPQDVYDTDGTLLHAKGDTILDEDGNPVLADDPYYNLDLGKLTDINGRALTNKTVTSNKYSIGASSLKYYDEDPVQYDENMTEVLDNEKASYRPPESNTVKYEWEKAGDSYALDANGNYIVRQIETPAAADKKTVNLKPAIALTEEQASTAAQEGGVLSDESRYPKTARAADGTIYTYSYALARDEEDSTKFATDANGNYTVTRTTESTSTIYATVDAGVSDALKNTDQYPDKYQITTKDADGNDVTKSSDTDDKGRTVTYEYRLAKDENGNTKLNEDGSYAVEQVELFNGEVELRDQELYGGLQAKREILTRQGVFSTADELAADPSASTKRGIPYYQKALDVMANTLASLLNNANLVGGDTRPLFSNDGTKDTWGVQNPNKPDEDPGEPINAFNIAISASWANGSLRVEKTAGNDDELEQSTASDNLTKIYNLLTAPQKFTPQGGLVADGKGTGGLNDDAASEEVFFTGSFQDLLTQHMAGGLGNDTNIAKVMLKNYETMSDELYVDRDAVMGVDLNDEAMNMMVYEKSYAAACRLMTTYDGMLDKLINGTAV